MSRRSLVLFWAAVVVDVLLLGGTVATVRRLSAGAEGGDVAVLLLSVVGIGAASLVAGRIATVAGRVQQAARAPVSNRAGTPRHLGPGTHVRTLRRITRRSLRLHLRFTGRS